METVNLIKATLSDIKDKNFKLAVLPWGATEPHNLHLPYLTDCLLAQSIALDAAEKLYNETGINCMVLPPVPFGAQNPGQRENTFCIHTRYSTQFAILSDIVSSLYYQGIRRLAIINGHGGNTFKPLIRDLANDFPDFIISVTDWFAIVPQEEYFENKDDHAGEMETSVLLHYHPNLVDMKKAGKGSYHPFKMKSLNEKIAWVPRHWNKASDDTGIGNPSKSTPEKGEKYAKEVVKRISDLFYDMAVSELY
ncbi:MAG: creatininase family protein [Bacteroidales bacterium]|nr:creatininase family protein [Bacteroidales bacterium]